MAGVATVQVRRGNSMYAVNATRATRALLLAVTTSVLLGASPLAAASPRPIGTFAQPGHLLGIDVSHWQGKIIWRDAKRGGVRFAIAKATEAQTFSDPQYARNQARADRHGVAFGAYHFARPDRSANDAVREADHFVRVAKLKPRHLVPVLDLETTGGLGPKALINWTRAWVQRVESRLGVKPMIYTSPYFWRDNLNNTRWFADNGYRLWIAHWRTSSPMVPAANWGGRGYSVWQLSDCGGVAGIRGCVDVDLLRGPDPLALTIRRNR
jgi:lysozyme